MCRSGGLTGWLIVNGFLHSNKFDEISQWLIRAAVKENLHMELKTNDEILVSVSGTIELLEGKGKKPDFVLFWDKDIRLAEALEFLKIPVFNNAKAIEVCDDKSRMHLALANGGIPTPKTIIAPMTYKNIGYNNFDFLDMVIEEIGLPMVVKECFGSFGQQVYLCNYKQQLLELVESKGGIPLLFQEFIQSSFGKDLRLQVVGDEVAACMYRYSENGDFRANITNGGKMKKYHPSKEQMDMAVKCCKVLGLDFAGVDLLFGNNGEPIVCEVNSNGHFKNIYDCTQVNIADAILVYIKEKLK